MRRRSGPRTGILGGTFDPLHLGHLLIAEHARDQLDLDSVLFVPAGRPPHKTSLPITEPMTRLDMVRAGVTSNPAFRVSTNDLDVLAPSLTFELLERLSRETENDRFFFIMGEDSLYDLASWVNPGRIVELATLAVARRPLSPSASRTLPNVPGIDRRLEWIASPPCEISSTDIRNRVRTGRSIRYMVPEQVRTYIETHGVYQGASGDDAEDHASST